MKTQIRSLTAIAILFIMSLQIAYAKKVTTEFKVYGQCGECKEKIEKALDVPGITFAEWNVETKMLKVQYNDDKYTVDQIHDIMHKLGYATDKGSAESSAEKKLPKCCQPGGH
ncbi:MAG: ATPase [Bacteroidetes bacterium]|nr:ATPase [Bacteroidota bacterium]